MRQENKCVVKIRTAMWSDKSGAYIKKSITVLKRQSEGYNVLSEDLSAIGAADVLPRITNLDACADGIYEMVICNESRDHESGHIDDYDYRLIPAERN